MRATNGIPLGCQLLTGSHCKLCRNTGRYVDVCNRPSRRIYVNNVTCVASHGITIGSEISGGVEDVFFSNMRLLASPGEGVAMVKLKNECGRGGYVRNIWWENMTVRSDVLVSAHNLRLEDAIGSHACHWLLEREEDAIGSPGCWFQCTS
jgi:polygalacturonase